MSKADYGKARRPEFLLALAVFETIREPNRIYTHRELGAVLGVSRTTIFKMERLALEKMRKAMAQR